jgi:hypothetical protein
MAMALKTISKNLSKRLNFLILFFSCLLILVNILLGIFPVKSKYTEFKFWDNFPAYQKIYLQSQYVSKHPTAFIPDEIINTYAGAEYIKGVNPILIASDTPPMGRYMIGLSILLFNNENVVTLIFALLSVVLMFLVSRQIFNSVKLSVIPPLLFSFEPIFKNQLAYSPLLDIFQLVFLLSCFYFFNKGLNTKKTLAFFIIANLALGLFISTKFFITGLTIVAAWYGVLVIRRQWEKVKSLSVALPISIAVLLLSYARVLAFGYTINKFLGIQKYVFIYHKTQLILPFSIWPLLLFNKWFVWYGNNPVISDPQWMITWPIITILSIITIFLYLFNKISRNKYVLVLMFWVFFYIGFFSFGQIASRYFVILLPILYIISLYGLIEILKLLKNNESSN